MAKDLKPNAKLAAVMGSLVNLKNVATHKSIALTIHVPAEAAQAVLQVFGWPTMVDPVPVAIARLEEPATLPQPPVKDVLQTLEKATEDNQRLAEAIKEKTELLTAVSAEVDRHLNDARPRHWPDLVPAVQTGIVRNERAFWAFAGVRDAEGAKDYIRKFCGVASCRDIAGDKDAEAKWVELQVRYGAWLREHRGAA